MPKGIGSNPGQSSNNAAGLLDGSQRMGDVSAVAVITGGRDINVRVKDLRNRLFGVGAKPRRSRNPHRDVLLGFRRKCKENGRQETKIGKL